MAWQLIYTSAPRLLEAGRSGFGTVARHRQISSLLVSTIERASQFARLPGLGNERVIFCHRIVAVAGGRFHVLSCIRDAGADYTGRTNHLAHHLIAEQREVAALGTRGASAADVLLAMSWASSWEEAPRFLEAADEIALANFPSQAGGAWAQVTGDARHAWLLASGEASRGAYLLCPPRTDARALFAESLRLSPDRLWQVPFTTALQPSDESSDFRWIALEADSTLRAQAESSARPVLDLSRPDTLSAPENPANAAIAGVPRPTALGTWTHHVPAQKSPAPIPTTAPKPVRAIAPRKRGSGKWLLAGGAAVIVAAIGFGVIRPLISTEQDVRARRDELKKRIAAMHVFTPQTAESFSEWKAVRLSAAGQIVTEIEKANDALKTVSFEKMRDAKSGDALQRIAEAANMEMPPEMQAFADRVRQADALNTELATPATSERAAYESAVRQRDAIESFAKETQAMSAFSAVNDELRRNRERAESAALLALLHPRDSQSQNLPPVDTALVKERLARAKPADAVAAKNFTSAEKLMKAWETVRTNPADKLAVALRDSRGEWPEWLIKQAEAALAKSRGEAAAASAPKAVAATFSGVPLYFFNGLSALKDARFPELEKGLVFQLRSPSTATTTLIDPTKQGTLRAKISDPALFVVNEAGKQITPERGAESLPHPVSLIAKNAAGREVMQLWIVAESDKALLPKTSGGLSRTGNILALDPAALGLPGTPASRMTLRFPASALPAGAKAEPLPVKDFAVDLAPLHEEFARWKKEAERQMKMLESSATTPSEAGASARFKELKQVIVEAVAKDTTDWAIVERTRIERKESEEKKREPLFKTLEWKRTQREAQAITDFGDASEPLFKQAGGCIKAFCQEATFQGHDALFTTGAELCKSAEDTKSLGKAFAAARHDLDLAIRNLLTSEDKGRYTSGLRALQAMVTLLSPETPELKIERAKTAAQLAAKQEELRRIDSHPLMADAVPTGVYRLSVLADGVEILLMEIELAR